MSGNKVLWYLKLILKQLRRLRGSYRSGMEQKALVCSLWPSDSYSTDLNLFKQKVGRQRECLGRMYFLFLRK